jgi:prepilin-type N-terminal cleavage/methylation domain-containing protein
MHPAIQKEGSPQVSSNNKGFTLIELLISVTLSVIAIAMVYAGYRSQQEAHTNERLVVDMQQNARSALAFMRREIRLAGLNPWALDGQDNNVNGAIDEAAESAGVQGFLTVRTDQLNFTMDLSVDPVTLDPGDGDDTDADENITYGFISGDADGDGIADSGAAVLGRRNRSGTAFQPLAFDVHAVAFAYAFDADGDGAPDTYPGVPGGVVIWAFDSDSNGTLDRHLDTNMDGQIDESDSAGGATLASVGAPIPSTVAASNVRAVQAWLLTRSQVPMKGHSLATQSFVVGPNHISVTDGFKRAVFNSMVTLRNP